MKWIISLGLVVLSFSVGNYGQSTLGQPAGDQNSENISPENFRDVAADLRCPTCTGISVLDSDAPFSVQIKNEVKDQLAAGKGKSEILRFFTDRYGPWILREPPKEGINLWAWIIPGGILLLGPLLIWYFVWNYRQDAGNLDGASEYEPQPVEDIVKAMNERLDDLRRKTEELS
jgi:cytochrome c-type biogenesis protein CcmH/NrfF